MSYDFVGLAVDDPLDGFDGWLNTTFGSTLVGTGADEVTAAGSGANYGNVHPLPQLVNGASPWRAKLTFAIGALIGNEIDYTVGFGPGSTPNMRLTVVAFPSGMGNCMAYFEDFNGGDSPPIDLGNGLTGVHDIEVEFDGSSYVVRLDGSPVWTNPSAAGFVGSTNEGLIVQYAVGLVAGFISGVEFEVP